MLIFNIECKAANDLRVLENGIIKFQSYVTEWRKVSTTERVRAFIRFDDQCGNNREDFSVTGETQENNNGYWREGSCGCIHDTITTVFPELKNAIKFHLMSTAGPMHYLANTVYLASNQDHNGLLKGEKKPLLIGGKAGAFSYEWTTKDGLKTYELPKAQNHETDTITLYKTKVTIDGKGKERQLDAARSSAVWPQATDDQLKAEPSVLKRALADRLPRLQLEFLLMLQGAGIVLPELWLIERDGQPISWKRTEGDVFKWFHKMPYSVSHAVAHEGYTFEQFSNLESEK